MSIEAILLNQTQRQALNAIKSDTENILSDTTTIINKLNNVYDKKRYGFRIKKSEGDPARRVEYIYDAVGMTPASMNYSTNTFNYGSWGNIWFIKQNYPCMVLNTGAEDYRLNPNDYSKKIDGTASDYANVDYAGNAMAAIPLCWVKRYEDDVYEYVIFCQEQYDDSYKAYAHTNANGTVVDRLYYAMFKGNIIDGKMRSLAGQMCGYSTNAQAELDAAMATNPRCTLRTWSFMSLMADLLTLISKTENSQLAFGQGQTTGWVEDASKNYGHLPNSILGADKSMTTCGQFGGYNDSVHHVKVFHIEDLWGNRWDRLQGLNQALGVFYAKMTPEAPGYSFTGVEGYHPLAIDGITAEHGWQKDTYMTEFGRIPTSVNGSDHTYTCDYTWINRNKYDAPMVALSGGNCNAGSVCGSRSLGADRLASAAWGDLGASLQLV